MTSHSESENIGGFSVEDVKREIKRGNKLVSTGLEMLIHKAGDYFLCRICLVKCICLLLNTLNFAYLFCM